MTPENLQKLAESKFDIKAAKAALLERVDSQLIITHNDGLFKATPVLIAYVTGLSQLTTGRTIILDEYNNPIKIEITKFLELLLSANQYALNSYRIDYNKLKKVRKGDKL